MERKAKTGGMWPPAKGHLEPPEERGRFLPHSLCRDHGPANTLISDFFLASRAVRGLDFHCFKSPSL